MRWSVRGRLRRAFRWARSHFGGDVMSGGKFDPQLQFNGGRPLPAGPLELDQDETAVRLYVCVFQDNAACVAVLDDFPDSRSAGGRRIPPLQITREGRSSSAPRRRWRCWSRERPADSTRYISGRGGFCWLDGTSVGPLDAGSGLKDQLMSAGAIASGAGRSTMRRVPRDCATQPRARHSAGIIRHTLARRADEIG